MRDLKTALKPFVPGVVLRMRRRWMRHVDARRSARSHDNELFYTLTPALLMAVLRAFLRLSELAARGGPNLLRDHAYYEFGVFKGFSIWYADQVARELGCEGFRCYGFDSFAGLPQTHVDRWTPYWRKGTYAASRAFVETALRTHGTDFSRVTLFEGFYSDELFGQIAARTTLQPAAICVIDSDLYESSVPVLQFMRGYLRPGTIVLFDDIRVGSHRTIDDTRGEGRALAEFLETYPQTQLKHLFDYGISGTTFEVESIG